MPRGPLDGVRLVIAVTAPRSATFYAGQLAALRDAGATVAFLSAPSADVADQCAAEGATFLPVAMERAPAPVADLRSLAAMTTALRRFRPDIVNAGTPKAGLLGMLAARALGIPRRVHTVHGLRYEAAHGPARHALWAAQRLSCAAATHIVCVGASLRERAVATRLFGPGAATVIGDGTVNGIDTTRFRHTPGIDTAVAALRRRAGLSPDDVVVGYLGRLARDKGIADLAAAWPLVRGARLLIGGTVDETDPLPSDVLSDLRTSGILLGHVDPVLFLAAIDVLVLPTLREGFPTVPLEAAAMGLPVVATRATGCADAVVDGVTGTLVPVGAPREVADAIATYVRDHALRERHGRAGLARVHERFRRERVHELTVAYYASLA